VHAVHAVTPRVAVPLTRAFALLCAGSVCCVLVTVTCETAPIGTALPMFDAAAGAWFSAAEGAGGGAAAGCSAPIPGMLGVRRGGSLAAVASAAQCVALRLDCTESVGVLAGAERFVVASLPPSTIRSTPCS
jgi:hypothetical protein